MLAVEYTVTVCWTAEQYGEAAQQFRDDVAVNPSDTGGSHLGIPRGRQDPGAPDSQGAVPPGEKAAMTSLKDLLHACAMSITPE